MRRFAETCEAVAATTKKNEKVRLVSAYLSSLPLTDAARAAVFFTGQAFPRCEEKVLAVAAHSFGRLWGDWRSWIQTPWLRSTASMATWAQWPKKCSRTEPPREDFHLARLRPRSRNSPTAAVLRKSSSWSKNYSGELNQS